MRYSLTIEWNGSEVMFARCSAVMACDTLNGFFAGNFAGVDHKAWLVLNTANVGAVLKMRPNDRARFAYSDETGRAVAVLTCVDA